MLDRFEAQAIEAIEKAMQEVNNANGKIETRILNAEYNMGKFEVLADILEGMNTERFISVLERTAADRNTVLKFIEQIYSIRTKTEQGHGSIGQNIIAGLYGR